MTERIAVVVVNWNGLGHLQVCVPAVLAQDYPDFELIVVDNGSDDGSVEWLRSAHPQVRLIGNDTNRGFAEATNQGIRATGGAFVAALNNDARPEADWLSAAARAMGSDERVGMVASQVRLMQQPDRLDSAGIEVDTLGIAWNRRFGQPVDGEPVEPLEVFGPSGAAALYRRAMLDQVGLFDERYFAYYEDVELAWRARRMGWRCLYAPGARVLHHRSPLGQQRSALKAYLLNRNRVWTLIRHYPPGRFLLWGPLILLFDTGSWLWPLLRGRVEAWRGHVHALRAWRWAWEERRRWSRWPYDAPLVLPNHRRLRAQR